MFRFNYFADENLFAENRFCFEITAGTDQLEHTDLSPEEDPETEAQLNILQAETEGLEVRTALQRRVGVERALSRSEEIQQLSQTRSTLRSTLFNYEILDGNGLERYMLSSNEKFTLFKIAEKYLHPGGQIWEHVDLTVDEFGRLSISARSILNLFTRNAVMNTVGFKAVITGGGKVKWVLADRSNFGPRQSETGSFTQFYRNELQVNMTRGRVNDNMSASETEVWNDLQRWMTTEEILMSADDHPDVSEALIGTEAGKQLENFFVSDILKYTHFEGENIGETPITSTLAQAAENLGFSQLVGTLAWVVENELVFTTPGHRMFILGFEQNSDGSYSLVRDSLRELGFDDQEANVYFAALPEVMPPSDISPEELTRNSLVENIQIDLENADGNIFRMKNGMLPGSGTIYYLHEIGRRVEADLRDHPEYFRHGINHSEITEISYFIAGTIINQVYTDNGMSNFDVRFSAKFNNVGERGQVELDYITEFEATRTERNNTIEFIDQTFKPEVAYTFNDNGNPIEYTGTPSDLRLVVEENLSQNQDEFFNEDPAITEAADYIMGLLETELDGIPAGAIILPELIINAENPTGLLRLNTPDQIRERALETVDLPLALSVTNPEDLENYGFLRYTSDNEEMHDQIQEIVFASMLDANMWTTPESDEMYVHSVTEMIVVDIMQFISTTELEEGSHIKIDYNLEGRNSEATIDIIEFTDENEALLDAMHADIDPLQVANDLGPDGFFLWSDETLDQVHDRIVELASQPSQASELLKDYASIQTNEEVLQQRIESFADYFVANITSQLNTVYPNGIREGHEFKFTFSRDAENPAGLIEVHEREEVTIEDSYAAVKNGALFGLEVSRFRNTPVGRHEFEISIKNELLANKERYFEQPNNPQISDITDNLAQEWAREFSSRINLTARNYEGNIELAAYINRGEAPRFEVVNSDEILRDMERQQRNEAIEQRYEEYQRNQGIAAWFVSILNPDISREELSAEMARTDIEGQSRTLLLLSLLFSAGARQRLRSLSEITGTTDNEALESSDEETEEAIPNLADETNMQVMDNIAMGAIKSSEEPRFNEMRNTHNVQGYRFEDFRLEENTSIKLIDARIQVQNLSELNNVEFVDSAGNVIHVTRPNTPPYIIDFGDREVYIKPNSSNGSETVLSMDIEGRLSYFNSENPTEQPEPEAAEEAPEAVS